MNPGYNPESNCKGGRRLKNGDDLLDWTLGLISVSLILNLESNELSFDGTKLPCNIKKDIVTQQLQLKPPLYGSRKSIVEYLK